jgi:hypothetical protein
MMAYSTLLELVFIIGHSGLKFNGWEPRFDGNYARPKDKK